jgi:hypothetical protein
MRVQLSGAAASANDQGIVIPHFHGYGRPYGVTQSLSCSAAPFMCFGVGIFGDTETFVSDRGSTVVCLLLLPVYQMLTHAEALNCA